MSSDPTNQFGSNQFGGGYPVPKPAGFQSNRTPPPPANPPQPTPAPASPAPYTSTPQPAPQATSTVEAPEQTKPAKPPSEVNTKLAAELKKFDEVAASVRQNLVPAADFTQRCHQAFDAANELFGNAPTWVCFYRELLGGSGLVHTFFASNADLGAFLRTEQYHQIQLMLTALRSRDMPENDPNDPQRMITVRLPKSLHEAMCEEAGRLNISVNRLCISRMLQLLDPKMIPETTSKPRGRKPRTQQKTT
ncbi:MAG: hypothetical protein AAF483_17485 [Planctomycetota bacterium]